MALLSDKQQRNLLIALGLTDFATRSRLSTAAFDLIIATARGMAPVAGRGAAAFVPRALGTARFIAMRHPVILGLVVTYEVIKHREKIAQLAREGWEIVDEPVTQYLGGVEERIREFSADPVGGVREMREQRRRFEEQRSPMIRVHRKPSAFNKAVSAGMKAIKKSTSYGKRGVIKPATKAFALVTKLAAAKKKKKKAPKSGIRRRIWNAMKGLR